MFRTLGSGLLAVLFFTSVGAASPCGKCKVNNEGKAVATASDNSGKPCCASAKPATTVASNEKKPGCGPCTGPCDKPCCGGAKAVTTVVSTETGKSESGEKKPCGGAATTTVASGGRKPCCAGAKAVVASSTASPDEKKPCHGGAMATTVSADDKKPCHGGEANAATTVASDGKKPCCGGAKAVTVASDPASDGKKPCSGASATTVASGGNKPCCGGAKAITVATTDKAGCNKPCGKSVTVASSSDESGCPIGRKVQAVLASLPVMKYRVGDKVTDCDKHAEQLTAETSKPIEFLVGEQAFTDRGEAVVKLASAIETQAEEMKTVQFVAGGSCMKCPMTARKVASDSKTTVTYRVGGVDFETREAADKAVEAVTAKLASVSMAYKVDGETIRCAETAGAKCKEKGAKMTYVVGEEETCCDKAAKLILANARVRAIVEAAAATSMSL
ncbi:MAG: hypothetical protein HOP29_19330 [Phycisphaerales bacterium]|nr:hypothetical protein [Phycisphaerales bacterium]